MRGTKERMLQRGTAAGTSIDTWNTYHCFATNIAASVWRGWVTDRLWSSARSARMRVVTMDVVEGGGQVRASVAVI